MKADASPIYLKLLISTAMSILLALLTTSAILYVNFEKIALSQVYDDDMETLAQTAKGVGAMTNIAVTLSNQIYNDLNVARLMYYAEPSTEDLRTADAQLTNYRLSLPFIDSVYVYNGRKETFYVNSIISRNEMREAIQGKEGFDDPYAVSLIDSFRSHRPYLPIPRVYATGGPEKTVKNYYTFIMYDAFARDDVDHAVIVNFAEDWITGFMSDDSTERYSTTFILNPEGIVVSASALYPMMSDASSLAYARRILAAGARGSFMETIGGKKYLASYTAPDAMGWRYVKLTPRDYVLRRVTRMKHVTILIGLALVAVGLVASALLTRRLYVPIDGLMTTLRRLSLEEKKNVRILRQVFFRDLFLGRGMYDGQTIEIKLEELGTAFNASGYYCVVLAKIDRYLEFSLDYTSVDQGIAKGAIMDECGATVPGNAKNVVLDMGSNGIAIVLNALELEGDLDPDALEARLVEFRERVRAAHGLSVSITVSRVEAGIQNLRELYAETLEASLYRLYRGRGCVIHAREVRDLAADGYEYPTATEKAMVASLLAGKIGEAKGLFERIVMATTSHPINVFNLAISRLAFAADEAVKTVRKYNADASVGNAVSLASVNEAETIEDVSALFYALFDEIGSVLLDRKANRGEQIIERINRHIETGYMRQDLYIDSIARFLEKSPTYISHVYKQRTGITILDKIIDVRMARAKELLLTTELSVAEVSERSGFSSSSYFFKVFRKVNGVTPNEFRGREEG